MEIVPGRSHFQSSPPSNASGRLPSPPRHMVGYVLMCLLVFANTGPFPQLLCSEEGEQ